MAPSCPAAMGGGSPTWLAARMLVFGLLVAILATAAGADELPLAALLKTLDLSG